MKPQGLCSYMYIGTKNYILCVVVWGLISVLHTTNTVLVGVLKSQGPWFNSHLG